MVIQDNRNALDKNKKTLSQLIQFICLGSFTMALFAAVIEFHFIISVAGLLNMLIPLLFAYPIIINKTKLLLVPTVILPLSMLLIDFSRSELLLTLFFVVFSIIAVIPGISAGFLIKLSRKRDLTMKKYSKAIVMILGVVLLIAPTLFISNSVLVWFFGNPIGAFFANRDIQAYVAEYFPDYDLIIEFPRHSWKSNSFESTIILRSNENITFRVYGRDGNFRNTYNEVTVFYLAQILEPEFGDSIRLIQVSNPRSTGHSVFHHQSNNVNIRFNLDHTDPYMLATTIIRSWTLLGENGFTFSRYNFHFYNDIEDRLSISDLLSMDMDDSLILLLENIYENFIFHGRYRNISHTMGGETRGWE